MDIIRCSHIHEFKYMDTYKKYCAARLKYKSSESRGHLPY